MAVDTRTAATARAFVAATMSSWGLADQIPTATLIIDQFVDTARRQGSALVDVRVCRTDCGARVEVIERAHPPGHGGAAESDGLSGDVLDALSSAWGRLPIGYASCLWADISESPSDRWSDPADTGG